MRRISITENEKCWNEKGKFSKNTKVFKNIITKWSWNDNKCVQISSMIENESFKQVASWNLNDFIFRN
jgi:hypothetical protein